MKYVGVDIGGTNLKAGLVNDEGSILAMEKRKIAEVSDQKALVEALVALTQSLTERGGLTPEQIRSVGVGVPGAVEIHSGAVLYTCNLPLRNVPLRKLFHRYLPYPLYVENDANCAALAEYYAGAGMGSKRFVTITLGTGVGAGILHNGQIYHGANGMAGEVGHMSIVYHGEPCPCGRRGCWERYASASALKRLTARAMEEHPGSILCRVVAENNGKVSGQSAFIAAREGDPVGQSVCRIRWPSAAASATRATSSCCCPCGGWWSRRASPATGTNAPGSSRPSWATTPGSSAPPCWENENYGNRRLAYVLV